MGFALGFLGMERDAEGGGIWRKRAEVWWTGGIGGGILIDGWILIVRIYWRGKFIFWN